MSLLLAEAALLGELEGDFEWDDTLVGEPEGDFGPGVGDEVEEVAFAPGEEREEGLSEAGFLSFGFRCRFFGVVDLIS